MSPISCLPNGGKVALGALIRFFSPEWILKVGGVEFAGCPMDAKKQRDTYTISYLRNHLNLSAAPQLGEIPPPFS